MRTYLTLLAAWALLPALAAAAPNSRPAPAVPTFEKDVRPIFKAHCFECHGEGKKLKGGLDLRLRRAILEGGDDGPALVPGKPGDSPLVRRVRSGEMPPGKKKLTPEQIAKVEGWIAAGAATARPEPKKLPVGVSILPEDLEFWSFQPIRRPGVPRVKAQQRIRTPIDAFLLARLEKQGLSFGPEADRRTLLRRATFDLLGLPPTPEEVEAFLNDQSPAAYERLIDRLLASPQYGERWGRHWLDVAGYADSEGYTGTDPVRKTAYKYRDYVVRAFNADMPFDQFIQEQLAGDEMVRPPYDRLPPHQLDRLIATGFLRMAPDGTASPGVDIKAAANQNVADTLQIVSTALLGLTVQCAQCHNHRYDPIPQADYYRLRAVFEPALDPQSWRPPAAREVVLFKDEERRRAAAIEKEAAQFDAERLKKQAEYIEATFQKQLDKIPEGLRPLARQTQSTAVAARTATQKKLLQDYPFLNVNPGTLYLYDRKRGNEIKEEAARAAKLRASKPVPDSVRTLTEVPGKIPVTRLFDRGDPEQPREPLMPASLTAFAALGLDRVPARDPALPSTGRRLAFARGLTSGKHPLTARVLVNRVWLHHFGKGIVNTPGDFGFLGERPSHPELLDWLASEFVDGGWRLKRLHRLLMTSTAYRQSSQRRPELEGTDPDNRLLARFSVRRLEAEGLRDALLAVSGRLNLKPFGPPVPVTQDEVGQVVIGNDIRNPGDGTPKGKVAPLGGEEFRRSVYVQARRSLPLGMLETFDAPAMSPNCEARNSSTVSTQALTLMNSATVLDLSEAFARRVQREAATDLKAQVAHAWRLAYAAEPSAVQAEQAVAFLRRQTEQFAAQKRAPNQPEPSLQALASFCQALVGSSRFLYVD